MGGDKDRKKSDLQQVKEEEGGGLSEINKYMKNTGSGKSLLKN